MDGATELVLRTCMDKLAAVLTVIFNLTLLHSEIPTCFKKAAIFLVPKKSKVAWFNDYHLVPLQPHEIL